MPVTSASAWIKKLATEAGVVLKSDSAEDKKEYVETLTDMSLLQLANDQEIAYRSMADLPKNAIVDGLRNPYDFVRLFDPAKDLVVSVFRHDFRAFTDFEDLGITVIEEYIVFCELMHPDLKDRYFLASWDDPDIPTVFDKVSKDLVEEVSEYIFSNNN
jgi:hypothetical protein